MGKLGLGPFGMALTVPDTCLDEAAELERLGYSAIISLDVYQPEMVTGRYAQLEATAPAEPSAAAGAELVIWGDTDTISARIREHLHAGADHVMLHVLSEGGQPRPMEAGHNRLRRGPVLDCCRSERETAAADLPEP